MTKAMVVASPYPAPGDVEAAFEATLTGFGVTVEVQLEPTGTRQFLVTGPRYRCTVPLCWCDRTPCTGQTRWGKPCKKAAAKGDAGQQHARDHCHGGVAAMHAQQVLVFAEAVLTTYGPDDRKARPVVGLPCGSIPLGPPAFLPIDGEQTTTYEPGPARDWLVTCDSLRCRHHGSVVALSQWPSEALAQSAVQRHKHWHRDPDACPEPTTPQAMTLIVRPAEFERNDWYHNFDGWQRIALISTPRREQESIVIWDSLEKQIATLDQRRQYLIVRADNEPSWTPRWDVARQRCTEPEVTP